MAECLGRYYMCNGEVKDCSLFDDSFLGGTGYIYEVFRVIDGIPLFLEDHLVRLENSVTLTGNSLSLDYDNVKRQIDNIVSVNNMNSGNLKIVYEPFTAKQPSLFIIYISEHHYPDAIQYRDGVGVVLLDGVRHNPNAKVMDISLRRQANRVKTQENVHEALLVDEQGCITEGSQSTVFFIIGDLVITPPLEYVLPGITRKHILECCKKEDIRVVEEKMPVSRLADVDAAFLCSTSRKVLPINRIADQIVDSRHPLIRSIMHAFDNHITTYLLHKGMDHLSK